MKNKKQIKDRLARIKHRKLVKRKRRGLSKKKIKLKGRLDETKNIADIKYSLLSDNLKYIADCAKTDILLPSFYSSEKLKTTRTIAVPELFSLVDNTDESFAFIKDVINCIYHNKVKKLRLDYSNCETMHLEAQIYLDVLLRDIFIYSRKLSEKYPHYSYLESVKPIKIKNNNVRKLLYSIGSFAILRKESIKFDDIVPYNLCEFKINPTGNKLFNIETKERHVTEMVEYVIDSLDRMNIELTADSIENLSIIIGEILINAEEHSTNKHRFSIGYFQEHGMDMEQYGIFNLAILNFGETIYDKFKDENCPRQDLVAQMEKLSNEYTKKRFFGSTIKEETLWTLYALQEEVTSVSPEKNRKRGNGSIKFIESFFNLKGNNGNQDDISRLAILSGNTSIIFDGTYGIQEIKKSSEKFKVMTFNNEGNISNKPDSKYVKFVENYFPGTIISAQILISKDDIL